MSFTDEDFKRLKESVPDDCEWVMDWNELQALLARLDAAEAIHEHHAGHDEDCDEMQHGEKCSCGFEAAEIKWAKAAGK